MKKLEILYFEDVFQDSNYLRDLGTTFAFLLDRRAFEISITAKHTAITWKGFENFFTVFTFIKKLAGVCVHGFSFLKTTGRTG